MTEPAPEITDPRDRSTLRAASGDTLLRTYAALTHQMHAGRRDQSLTHLAVLRAKRDIVAVEILRRMGQISGERE